MPHSYLQVGEPSPLCIVLGAQQYTKPNGKGRADVFANAIKHDHKSPNPTTRWSDIIKLK